eukprot:7153425-Karenia_brevis.AAC.1
MCASVAHTISPILTAKAAKIQIGFIRFRQLLINVVELDAASRVYSLAAKSLGPAALAFFDFSAAFPSVALRWIMM